MTLIPVPISRPTPHKPLVMQTPPYREGECYLEIDVRPGTLLGGPLCRDRLRARCEKVDASVLGERHLAYPRRAYLEGGPVRGKLDELAHQHRFSRNRLGLFGLDDVVLANIAWAISTLAKKLPTPVD